MLRLGIIEESHSPWMSPAVYVPKKTGGLRICIDYRELNKRTKRDSYPLPLIDEVQDRLAGSTIFSTLDLQSGYWQMPLNPSDKEKTAFCPGPGFRLYQFCRMPFGLMNAPSSFQRMMDQIFRSLPFVSSYIDDVLIHSSSVREHKEHLQEVFNRISEAGLTLRGQKCKLGLSEVKYLGHVFSAAGMQPDPEKVSVTRNWPTPTNVAEVRQFLGLASYYRRYISQFAQIATPLHQLTCKNSIFQWSSACQESFDTLKSKLMTPPTLAYPHTHTQSGPFVLHTDASSHGVGAVLEQDGRVIVYVSRALTAAERNYSVIQKECLAIVYATKQFRQYLLGRPFELMTDHAPLQWLSAQKAEGMLARWSLALQEFDFKISYKPGVNNGNADALSRIPPKACSATMLSTTTYRTQLQEQQRSDSHLSIIYKGIESQTKPTTTDPILRRYIQLWHQLSIQDGVLCRKYYPANTTTSIIVPIIPLSLRPQLLQEFHNTPAAGHLGSSKTLSLIRKEAYWVNMATDIHQYCTQCTICQQSKLSRPQKAPLQTVPIGRPWQMVAVDVLEVPISTSQNRYLLVFQDYFTKWPEAIPLHNQTAESVTQATIKVFATYGIPDILHSDQGRNFESALLNKTLQAFGTDKSRTTAYHPQGDGMVERFNRSLLQLLRSYVETKDDWEMYLPLVLFAYRTASHASTGLSPYLLMYGREPKTPPLPVCQSGFEPSTYVAHVQGKLAEMRQFVDDHLEKAAHLQKDYYDQRTTTQCFNPNDLVWLQDPTARKLDPIWEGGWSVRSVKGPVTVEIEKGPVTKVVHVNRLRHRLQPHSSDKGVADGECTQPLSFSQVDHNIVLDTEEQTRRYPQRDRRPPDRLTY